MQDDEKKTTTPSKAPASDEKKESTSPKAPVSKPVTPSKAPTYGERKEPISLSTVPISKPVTPSKDPAKDEKKEETPSLKTTRKSMVVTRSSDARTTSWVAPKRGYKTMGKALKKSRKDDGGPSSE